VNPSATQGEARLRGLAHAVGRKPSASQDEACLRGLRRIWSQNHRYPCRSVFYS